MLATKSTSPTSFRYKEAARRNPHYTEAVLKQRAGRALFEMRSKAGYSVGYVADHLGMSTERLTELEEGRSTEGLTIELLVRAAAICGRTLKATFTVT